METVEYKGWRECIRLTNGKIELIATTAVGPRIIRFGFVGGDNEFKEYDETLGLTGGDEWRLYGGHRLWHSPEEKPRTYYPDNEPVQVETTKTGVRLIQNVEPTTGIEKQIDLSMSADVPHVKVVHRLINRNLWTIELAPWALSVMAQGGRGIVPLPPRGTHEDVLEPQSTMTLWAYTDMSDRRWTWGPRYAMLCQDPSIASPQKMGFSVPDGWVAYLREGHLFVKKFVYVEGGRYSDFGSSVEVFTNGDMLEAETLGPRVKLDPGEAVEHVEHWFVFENVPAVENDDDVDKHVLGKVRDASMPD